LVLAYYVKGPIVHGAHLVINIQSHAAFDDVVSVRDTVKVFRYGFQHKPWPR